MDIEAEIKAQMDLSTWVDSQFKREFPGDRKSLIAMSCFDLVIEHHTAITLLCTQSLFGSMFALYRIIFESLIRGMYVQYCADDKIIDNFEKGKLPQFSSMILEIENKINLSPSLFSELKKSSYTMMNDFTHTGYKHLIRRNADGATGHMSYPNIEKIRILQSSGAFLLLAASALSELVGDKALQDDVLAKTKLYASLP